MNKKRVASIIFWLLTAGLFVFLSLNRHSRTGVYNYHCELWADKAGYNVYLPFAFIYHFNARSFPDSISEKAGNGFTIDTVNNILKTKYPYGVALMQTPFFLISHFLAKPLGYQQNGYSLIYNRAPDFAALFYFLIGLAFLFAYLKKIYSKKIAFFALFFMVAATNLYYYTIDESGMSHVYSFALFSALIWLADIFDVKKIRHILFFTFLSALLVVVRPINVIFIPFLLWMNKEKIRICLRDLKNINALKIVAAFLPAIIIILGQLTYWKYSSGSFFTNPYRGESFTNLGNPQLLKVWFSTNNGLFTYTPGWIFIIAGIFVMIFTKHKQGLLYLIFFLLLSYIISSWWSWQFGCGFGHRAYVDYLPAFIVPAISFWKKISFSRILQSVTLIILCSFSIYNIALVYSWDGCWYGGLWDWQLLWQKFISVF